MTDHAFYVPTLADLSSLTTEVAVVVGGGAAEGDGAGGTFAWDPSDRSAECALDPHKVVFHPKSGDDGSGGAYVRQYEGEIDVGWWTTTTASADAASFLSKMSKSTTPLSSGPTIIDLYRNQIRVVCPNKTADGQALMVAAHAQAMAEGKRVVLGAGVWYATDEIVPTTVVGDLAVEGVGDGRTTIYHKAPGKTLFRRSGTFYRGTARSPKINASATRLGDRFTIDMSFPDTVETPPGSGIYLPIGLAGLEVGAYVRVQDEGNVIYDYGSNTTVSRAVCRVGQWHRIKAIEGNVVIFYGVHEFDYTSSTRLARANFGGNISARNLVLRMDPADLAKMELDEGNPDYIDPETIYNGFQMITGRGGVFEGLKLYDTFQTAIGLSAVIDTTIEDVRAKDLGAKADNGAYAISMGGACSGIRVKNVSAENVRHLITCVIPVNGDTIEVAHVDVIGCQAWNCRFTPFDFHPGARHTRFLGCQVWSSGVSSGGTSNPNTGTDGAGYQLRGRFMEVTSCTAVGTYRGVYAVFGEGHRINNCTLDNNFIGVDIFRSPGTSIADVSVRNPVDTGVWLHSVGVSPSAYDTMPNISARNITVEGNPMTAAFLVDGVGTGWDLDYGRSLKAPSAAAKFSGVPLKLLRDPNEWYVVYAGAPGTTVTGTLTETVLAAVTVPGGSMGPNGVLRIRGSITKNNSANVKTYNVNFDGVPWLNDATQSNGVVPFEFDIEIRNAGSENAQIGRRFNNVNGATITWLTSARDTTTNRFVHVKATLADIGDLVTLQYLRVETLYRD